MWKKEIRKYLVPASICGFAFAMTFQPVQAAELNTLESYEVGDEEGKLGGTDINEIYNDGEVIGDNPEESAYEITSNVVEIDSMTGIPDDVSGIEGRNSNPYVTNSCYFDTTSERYVYTVGTNSNAVVANVASGMVTSMPVAITVDTSYTYVLYRNGEKVEDEVEISNIEQQGAYSLEVTNGIDKVTPVKFQIVGEYTNLECYEMPEGFHINSVTRDGGSVGTTGSVVMFEEEGSYDIDYACSATGEKYSLSVKVDHTPPVLELEELNDKYEAHGPVDISEIEVEPGFGIRIIYEGEEMPYARVLRAPGNYEITIQDAAGNRNTYGFIIRMYLNISSVLFILAMILAIAGIVGYVLISKKKLKVR